MQMQMHMLPARETWRSTVRGNWLAAAPGSRGVPLVTALALVEGDILTYVDEHRTTTLRQLSRALAWPSRLIMMGLGALIRDGLVRGLQRELDVVVTSMHVARP